ncbi:unnamed protein product [Prorocentrum cordatum]|uniref:RNA-directed RNA polymerase n=1 Tax=Prorocentrum cordatum TaxID=2364126 RepID=A0ABN9QWF4_9DINO|nr:unnamed protein product [Polarella glacialis]
MLGSWARPPLQRLYVGTLAPSYSCPEVLDGRGPCAAGALYGFSRDIVGWVVQHLLPTTGSEDMEACLWARQFERAHAGSVPRGETFRLDPRGLLEALSGDIDDAWVHPVKTRSLYLKCTRDRTHGCRLPFFPNSDVPARVRFRLPSRNASHGAGAHPARPETAPWRETAPALALAKSSGGLGKGCPCIRPLGHALSTGCSRCRRRGEHPATELPSVVAAAGLLELSGWTWRARQAKARL